MKLKMFFLKKLNFIFFFNIFFLFCLKFNLKSNNKNVDVFIFVHGTYGLRDIKKNLHSLKFIYQVYKDIIDNNFLDEMLKKRWEIPLQKINYLMGLRPGICKIEDESEEISEKAILTLKWLKEGLIKNYSNCSDFYLFNWDGLIYEKNRMDAGKDFYDAIIVLKKEYLEKGLNPKMHLICYSHGGTVASYLFKFAKENNFNDLNLIECLILLGVPITKKIKNSIFGKNNEDNYFFNKVLNIYSTGDYLQLAGSFFDSIYVKRSIKEKRKNLFEFEFQYNLDISLENIKDSFKKNNFFEKIKNEFLKLFKPPKIHRPDHAQLIYYAVPKKEIMTPVIIFIPYFLKITDQINTDSREFKSIFSINTIPNKLFIVDKELQSLIQETDLEDTYKIYQEQAKKISI